MKTTDEAYFFLLTKRSWFRQLVRLLFNVDLKRHFSGKVLDIGCGIGEFQKVYPDSIGVDNNRYLAVPGNKFNPVALLSDANFLPFSQGEFSGVLLSNILEHLDLPGRLVKEAGRVLKPGGIAVVTVPMQAGFKSDPTHITHFSRDSLVKTMADGGFLCRRLYYFPFPWEKTGDLFYFCELRGVFQKGVQAPRD